MTLEEFLNNKKYLVKIVNYKGFKYLNISSISDYNNILFSFFNHSANDFYVFLYENEIFNIYINNEPYPFFIESVINSYGVETLRLKSHHQHLNEVVNKIRLEKLRTIL